MNVYKISRILKQLVQYVLFFVRNKILGIKRVVVGKGLGILSNYRKKYKMFMHFFIKLVKFGFKSCITKHSLNYRSKFII